MALRVGKVMQNMAPPAGPLLATIDRKSTRLNSSHLGISYAVFCLKKKNDTLVHAGVPVSSYLTAAPPGPKRTAVDPSTVRYTSTLKYCLGCPTAQCARRCIERE